MPDQTLRINDMAGLLASIPALLKFNPTRSIVALFLSGRNVNLTARMDLHAPAQQNEVARTIRSAAERSGASELVLVGYVEQPLPWLTELLRDLAICVELESGPVVRRMAVVGDDGWCELPDWDESEPELRDLAEIEEHPLAIRAIYEGRPVYADRQTLAERVQPGSEQMPEGFGRGFSTTMSILAEADEPTAPARCMAGLLDDLADSDPDGHQLGQLVALAAHPSTQEVTMARLAVSTANHWLDVWSRAARVSSGSAAHMPLVYAGMASWLTGDGTLLNIAHDHAERLVPDSFGTKVLAAINALGLPPAFWDAYRETLTEHPVAKAL